MEREEKNTLHTTFEKFNHRLRAQNVSKTNIFGLKMMVKSGLEKKKIKFLHAQSLFLENIFCCIL